MRIMIVLLATLVLAGCPFVKTEYEIRPVPVPVIIHSEVTPPEIEPMPRLPIYDLTRESSDEQVTLAIDKSIIILETYKQELETAIRPFQDAAARRSNAEAIAELAVSRVQATIDELLERQNNQEDE